ncbi:MAG: NAD-dependent epimerase/dehydratase family protein [Candidatus Hodarchaeales archaeon]|jgi:nucleoside-diphosphate-sugar epimerase
MDGNILVTGACGQIGTELIKELRANHGTDKVIASDVRIGNYRKVSDEGPFEYLDVLDMVSIERVIVDKDINTIYHLASILSAKGEKNPLLAYKINISGMVNILEAGRRWNIDQVIWPSSIAAFGPTTPRDNVSTVTITRPTTMYGISKVTGELLTEYYFQKYNLDGRSVRLPGIISHIALPGGGTTDYAVDIFYAAIRHKKYTCFVNENTVLPMMYMPDCLKALIDLAEADKSKLKSQVYNITSISFSAGELATEIKKIIPEFEIEYKPDFRQAIADSWPRTIDDSEAREEWNWKPDYDLARMTADMIENLQKKIKPEG